MSRLDDVEGPSEEELFGASPVMDDVAANTFDMMVVGVVGLLTSNASADAHFDQDVADVLTDVAATGVHLVAFADMSETACARLREANPGLAIFEEFIVTGEEDITMDDPELWEIVEEVSRHLGGLSDALVIDAAPAHVMSAEQAGIEGLCVADADTLRTELRLRGVAC